MASVGRKLLAWWFLLAERGPFIRFLLFGTWNTIWTFALYAFLVATCQMNHLLAIFIVWAIAFVVGYVVNFLWVFRTAQRLRLRHHLRRYVILLWGTFALNLMLLWLLTEVVRVPPLPAQFIVFPLVVLMNFLGGRLWAFRAIVRPSDSP